MGAQNVRLGNLVSRQEEAKDRQADYNKLTVEQKIARLDAKLGKGVGAAKQRARLLGKDTPRNAKTAEVVEAKEVKKEKASKKERKKE